MSYEDTYQPNRPNQYNQLDGGMYFYGLAIESYKGGQWEHSQAMAARAITILESISTIDSGWYENLATNTFEPIDFEGIRERRDTLIQKCHGILGEIAVGQNIPLSLAA